MPSDPSNPTDPNQDPGLAEFSKDETLSIVQGLVEDRNFKDASATANNFFAIHVTHWLLETFGQKDSQGEYTIYQGSDGFPGAELPMSLQQLIVYDWKDELHLRNENFLRSTSAHEFIETDPFIPDWETIKQIPVYSDQLDYINSHPEVKAGIKPGKVEVIPQVKLLFKPSPYSPEWGLEFLVSQTGVRVAPFGEAGKTWAALNYVMDNQANHQELSKNVCNLAIIAARHAEYSGLGSVKSSAIDLLQARLCGEAPLPLCPGNFQPRPGTAILRLLVDEATS